MKDIAINPYPGRAPLRDPGGWARPFPHIAPGAGAVIRLQTVRAEPGLDCETQAFAEVDPGLLEDFLSSSLAAGVDFVSLEEARRRLAGAAGQRFACLTLDGASAGARDLAIPLFRRYGLPYAVFISPAAHDEGLVPWWLALEALAMQVDSLSLAVQGTIYRVRCRTPDEKSQALDHLAPLLLAHPEPAVRRAVYALCEAEGVEIAALAAQSLMSWDEARAVAADPLATIGLLAPDSHGAGAAAYDSLKDAFVAARGRLSQALSRDVKAIAFSAGWYGHIEPRVLDVAEAAGFATACLPGGGAAFAEPETPLMAVPRVLVNNHAEVAMDALALCGAVLPAAAPRWREASAA